MFKWPEHPSPRAPKHELADYAELICLRDNTTSATALSRLLTRLDENDYSDGVPEEEEIDIKIEEVYGEVEKRREVCGDGYPFTVGEQGNTLRITDDQYNAKHIVYRYLLLATRLNMNSNNSHAGIDGALLFEKLSAEVAREYFGDRAKSIVFGTASDSPKFEEKVNQLCHQLGEGVGFANRDWDDAHIRDGKLDIVTWKPFSDERDGQLIGFGQCKTGTNYKDSLTQLQPDAFCNKWLSRSPAVSPVRMFFLAEALDLSQNWRNMSIDAGLLFDRCRIIDFCSEVNSDVLDEISIWTESASYSEVYMP